MLLASIGMQFLILCASLEMPHACKTRCNISRARESWSQTQYSAMNTMLNVSERKILKKEKHFDRIPFKVF